MALAFDAQQRRACQVERNAVVMAGAGSGKTSVLAERFAWLLETGRAQIEQILSLTFTRKATAEMVEKIYRRLRDSADPLVREQLARFDQAQISTLDSFCTQIVRSGCHRFGLPPDFQIDEEATQRLARETAFQFLLAHLDHPGLARLLEQHGFERVVEGVFVELALRHLPLGEELDYAGMAERQVRALQEGLQRHLDAWEQARAALLRLPARNATMQENQDGLRALGGLAALARQRRYGELAAAVDGVRLSRRTGGSEAGTAMKELVEQLLAAREPLALIASTLEQAPALRGLLELLPRFQEAFDQARRRERLLTFTDAAHLAVRSLLADPALRRFYKERFRFIMIDEFQDNNRLQKDLLYLLAERRDRLADRIPTAEELEPDKLFFVGDEKQSIYRFRGADVSVFKALSEDLCREPGQVQELPTNYRSEPGLVRFFNRLFPRIMADAREAFEARFRELAPREQTNRERPQILFLYKPPREGGERQAFRNEEIEAWRLAELIRQTVDGRRLTIAEKDASGAFIRRPADFGDFALLLRSTGNQILYERVFRRFSIPYTTQNARSLFLEAPLYDFYQLLQLAVHPDDRLAYAALLRSPLVNVSDPCLIRILDAGGEEPFAVEEVPGIGEEDRRRLELGRRLWRAARDNADRIPLAELVDQLWADSGYAYLILHNPQNHNFLDYHEYLVRMAERADRDNASLARFLDFIRGNLGAYERQEELELLQGRGAGVQILTIHRAKGLEFPVVILADTGNRGRNDQAAAAPFYALPGLGFTFNLGERNWFAQAGREQEEREEIAELKRLLYVAVTRARNHLILSGVHNAHNRKCPRAHLNMLLAGLQIAEPHELEEDLRDYRFRLELIREPSEAAFWRPVPAAARPDLQRLSRLYEDAGEIHRELARQVHYSVTGLVEELQKERPLAGAPVPLPRLPIDGLLQEQALDEAFGELTHELLQRRLLGVEEPADEDWLPEELAARIPPQHRPALLAEARRLADRFLASELGQQAAAAARCFPEYSFLYHREPHWISGRVDLYFEDGGTAWVIDFKTGRSYREGEFDVQLALYRLALGELTDREVACRVVLLRSGRVLEPGEVPDLEGRLQRILAGPSPFPAGFPR